jgi:hypothetical protein
LVIADAMGLEEQEAGYLIVGKRNNARAKGF